MSTSTSDSQQFSFGERLGMFFSVQSSILSVLSVTVIMIYIFVKWSRRTLSGKSEASVSDSSLFLNLMVADLIQALGTSFLTNERTTTLFSNLAPPFLGEFPIIKWIADAKITEGHLCTAQAALKQVGINGVALTTMAIALHTFAILILRWRIPKNSSKFVVLGIWVFTALVVGIPNAVFRHDVYYGADPGSYWCWILKKYRAEQVVSEYLWVWSTMGALILLYGFMFLVIRGYVIIDDEGVHWHSKVRAHLDLSGGDTEEDRENKVIAKMMLLYPAVYIGYVLPNTFSRWFYFSGYTVPPALTLFAQALYALSGVFNLFLFFFTRPEMVIGPAHVELAETPSSPNQNTIKYGHLPNRIVEDSDQKGTLPDFDANSLLIDHQSTTLRYSPVPGGLVPRPGTGGSGGGMGYPPTSRPLTNEGLMHGGSNSFEDEEDYGRLPG
ncbi:uncharacterized protein LACBIDRAFT_314169 [Laccaria bicolor S238N-H82]|uniref:Predicted protein n=1 Tax=Laccaria bicolor (strain S238N-H82 / ATCC MYA-4686) TaxID=486041 RepID=B0D1R3_LACBS|nr:uncharacterized protein LACBIDRAFT_314169 [Laccaria bicolor S238N-H82]EDR12039.1 predicted protein [Laccaria bicolor S238N-H82]|eukprot:XP_001877936.1 predicted protein [Laccaria bicolor S238N-H82]